MVLAASPFVWKKFIHNPGSKILHSDSGILEWNEFTKVIAVESENECIYFNHKLFPCPFIVFLFTREYTLVHFINVLFYVTFLYIIGFLLLFVMKGGFF